MSVDAHRSLRIDRSEVVADGPAPVGERLRRWAWRCRGALIAGGVTVLAFALRAGTAVASFETADERIWMDRSSRFWDALVSGHFADASASHGQTATMPGVTTMWIGTLARGMWAGGTQLGLWKDTAPPAYGGATDFAGSGAGLDLAQLLMALTTAVLVGVLVLLLGRWAGWGAAAVAGVLIATEPFLIAHGAVLHTDELAALFGLAGLVALALALGIPEPTPLAGRGWVAAAGGALFAGGMLTKLSNLALLPSIGLLAGWAVARIVRRRGAHHIQGLTPGAVLRVMGCSLPAFAVTVVALYPALWADPAGELRLLQRSSRLAGAPHLQFFLGEAVADPSASYYLVALPFRVTPWLLVAGVIAGLAVWWLARTGGFGAAAAVMGLPLLVVLSVSAKKFDRYGLVLVMLAAVVVGVVASASVRRLARPAATPLRRVAVVGAIVGAVAISAHAAAVAPWGLAYFNPLLGGPDRVERTLLVGWGEGLEQVGHVIAELENGDCDGVTVVGLRTDSAYYRCGKRPAPGEDAKYMIDYISIRQVAPGLEAMRLAAWDDWLAEREVLAEITIRGLAYVRIYGPPPDWTGDG